MVIKASTKRAPTAKKFVKKTVAKKAIAGTAATKKPVVKKEATRKPAARKAVTNSAPRKSSAGDKAPKATTTKLLSGGNPQIAKGHGDAPVQAYIAALSGWKRDAGQRLDTLIERTVPGVRKAVKWNSPLYGADDEGWFLGLHVYTNYIKVAFFRGASLKPQPPDASKTPSTRYLNLREGALDEKQFVDWVKQASKLPGERM